MKHISNIFIDLIEAGLNLAGYTLHRPPNENPWIETTISSKDVFLRDIVVVDVDKNEYDIDDVPSIYIDAIRKGSKIFIQFDDHDWAYYVVKVTNESSVPTLKLNEQPTSIGKASVAGETKY